MQFPFNFNVFYIGMNSIVLYLGHYVAWQMGPFNYISGPMNTHWDNLVESIWSVSAWLIVAYVMYRKKVFITVWCSSINIFWEMYLESFQHFEEKLLIFKMYFVLNYYPSYHAFC